MEPEANVLDLLLKAKIDRPPEKSIRSSRLSRELGQPVVFKIRAVGYGKVTELKDQEDVELRLVLAGLAEPDLKDSRLLEKYGAPTPMELLRDMRFLLPGEVTELAREIEKLSGFRKTVFEEVRKN